MIVNVRYINKKTGELSWRAYSYRCSIPVVCIGMRVICPVSSGESIGIIDELDVPESRIDERVLPILKEITKEAEPDGE